MILETTKLTLTQQEAIHSLWNNEYPEALKYMLLADFQKYLDNLASQRHYLLVNAENKITGWCFSFVRDREKWFAIILDKQIHGKGYGTKLLNTIKEKEMILNGWAIDHNNAIMEDGAIYRSPLGFYLKNNFVVQPGMRLETEKISAVKIVWRK